MPHKMVFYAIRHKPTGYYLCAPYGRNGRGSSFMKPQPVWAQEDGHSCLVPLLKPTIASAKGVLGQWALGRFFAKHDSNGETEIKLKPDNSRIKEDMEIVKVEFMLP